MGTLFSLDLVTYELVVSPSEDYIGTYLLLLKLEDDNTCGDALLIQSCEVYFELEITNQEN